MTIATAAIVGGVVAAGSIAAGAAGAGDVSAPDPRSPAGELQAATNAQLSVAPQILSAEQQYQPQYAELANRIQAATARSQAGLVASMQPQYDALNNASATAMRTSTVADLQHLAPGITAAWRAANPGQATLLDRLTQSANEGLDAGYSLTPQEQRMVSQNTRSAQAARGMGYGPADALQESQALNLQGTALRNQRLQQAGNVAALGSSILPNSIATLTGLPYSGVGSSSGLLGTSANTSAGPRLFDPTNSYFSDLFNTNYNAQAAANIASANNQAALIGGGLKIAGGAAGSYLGSNG